MCLLNLAPSGKSKGWRPAVHSDSKVTSYVAKNSWMASNAVGRKDGMLVGVVVTVVMKVGVRLFDGWKLIVGKSSVGVCATKLGMAVGSGDDGTTLGGTIGAATGATVEGTAPDGAFVAEVTGCVGEIVDATGAIVIPLVVGATKGAPGAIVGPSEDATTLGRNVGAANGATVEGTALTGTNIGETVEFILTGAIIGAAVEFTSTTDGVEVVGDVSTGCIGEFVDTTGAMVIPLVVGAATGVAGESVAVVSSSVPV